MENKIDFSDLGAEPITPAPNKIDFSDLGAEPVPVHKTVGARLKDTVGDLGDYVKNHAADTVKNIGKSAWDTTQGFENGATMGTIPALNGRLAQLMDKLQSTGHSIAPSLIDESLSDHAKRAIASGAIKPNDKLGRLSDSDNIYSMGRDVAKDQLKESEDGSPWLYNAGQVGGGIATGMLGGAAVGAGAKAIGALPSVANASTQLATSAPKLAQAANYLAKGTTAIPKVARLAALAAPEGAVNGLFNSNSNIIGDENNDPSQVAVDTLKGAAQGSALGAGIGLATHAVPAAYRGAKNLLDNMSDEHPEIGQIRRAFNQGVEGNGYATDSARRRIQSNISDASGDMVDAFKQGRTTLGQELGSIVNSSKQPVDPNVAKNSLGSLQSMYDDINKGRLYLPDRGNQKLEDLLAKFHNNQASPTDLYEIKKYLAGVTDPTDVSTNRKIKDAISSIQNEVLNPIPGYKPAAAKFAQFAEDGPESVISKGIDDEVRKNQILGDMKHSDNKIYNNLDLIQQQSGRTNVTGEKTRTALERIKSNLDNFEQSYPGEFQRITGNTTDGLINPIEDNSADEAIRKVIARQHGDVTSRGGNLVESALGLGKTGGYLGANWAGQGLAKAQKFGSTIYNKTGAQHLDIANRLINDPQTSAIGKALADAVKNNDLAKKNAALFTILQNPAARRMIGEGEDQK